MGRQKHRAAVRRKEPWTTSQENIIELNEFKKSQQTKISLLPRSLAQEKYIDALKDPNVSVVFATGPAGTGKAQPLTAKIKTPSGWTTMGEIKPGDVVSTPDGKVAKVVEIFPQGEKETFIMEFRDGRKTECCGDHLWKTYYNQNKHPKLLTTSQLIECQKTHKRPHKIDLIEHELIDDIELPIHPYLLGALLGDGSLSHYPVIGFTSSDEYIIDKLNTICGDDGQFYHKPTTSYDFVYKNPNANKMQGRKGVFNTKLQHAINTLGLFGKKSNTKFIPDIYLRASKAQKLELLQGLMDTDGFASKKNQLVYTTVSKELCDNVVYLIRSLGGSASISYKTPTYMYKNQIKTGKLTYDVTICYNQKSKLVSLPKKKERLHDDCQYSINNTIAIKSITPSGMKECQCILIDSDDHLYITDEFIVTHNTMLATLAAIQQLKNKQIEKIIITRPAVSVDEQHGFLPGTLIEKMQPWVLPILDYFAPYYNKKQITNLIEHDVLEIAPLAYMRGRTFNNCFIIADECQNTLPSQMKMLLTRIGMGSKVVVTGDVEQHDRGFEQNGLRDILDRMQPHPSISVCSFGKKDISRHPLIETILDFYK